MKVIKEHLLDKKSIAPQTVYLPKDAEVIAAQDTPKGLFLQTISELTESCTELRTFKICSVDENIYADNIKYIDNFESDHGRLHILEFI